MAQVTVEELLAKAKKPSADALQMHPFYRGKMETVPRCTIRGFKDFSIWYTPGVAAACKAIQANKDLAYDYTWKWNTIAVVSDGTRVLGLGDIGPEAAIPVMEGKALLFKYLGGVDAVHLCLKTKSADDIINTVRLIQPSYGGINLEDISQPKCFRVLDTLRADPTVEIPVWHDDQQGTACVILAALINALRIVGKPLDKVKLVTMGAGAATIATIRILLAAGITPGNLRVCDSKGLLGPWRQDVEAERADYVDKWKLCQTSNSTGIKGGPPEGFKGADVCIALSKPEPGTIAKEWVTSMAKESIVFAMANPIPEIWPWDAKAAGARIVGTGRSDFPNQVNNSTGFPGIFRGTLDVRAKTITDEMCIAAAMELAKVAQDRGLNDDYITPSMDDWEIFPREAVAVAMKAQEQGIARINVSREDLYKNAMAIIKRSRDMVQMLMKEQFIPPYTE